MELKLNVPNRIVHSCRNPSSDSSAAPSLYRILSYTNNGSSTDRKVMSQSEEIILCSNDLERFSWPKEDLNIDSLIRRSIKDKIKHWQQDRQRNPFAESQHSSIKGVEVTQPGFLALRRLNTQEWIEAHAGKGPLKECNNCLLYTSDAADE